MGREIDKEFLILALSRVLSRGGGCAASHSSNFGEQWYLQLFLWRSNVFCVKWKDWIASIELILNTPDAANMPLILQRHMSLLWGWWRQYMWTWWSPFRTGRSTSMQFTYLQCEFAMLPEKMVLICEILKNFKSMIVRNENKNIKWQGRSCHVHRDCNRYHTSPWTHYHSCKGGSYNYSKAWNDFWISHNLLS